MLRERAADEVTERAQLMAFEPLAHRGIGFRRGAVGHGLEDLGDGGHVLVNAVGHGIGWRYAAA